MASMFGTSVRVSVFGQSHSPAIGCVIDGLPSGYHVDIDELARFLSRRAPGQHDWSTRRHEQDAPRIVSGLDPDGLTCGAPLTAVIENTDTRSQDYAELARLPRPGHADWVADVKWHGAQDVAGGGHFSGRLTAPLCVAGGICLQILGTKGIRVGAHLSSVADVVDEGFSAWDDSDESREHLSAQLDALADGRVFPTIDTEAGNRMRDRIEEARTDLDSVGGTVECVSCGIPAGVGAPMADGIENVVSRNIFCIPAVKGIEFGRGFAATAMRGSEHNDPYELRDGAVRCRTNNAGGILGGITTGMPVLFRVAVKPTSSISKRQDTIDLETMEPAELVVRGRHDPCVVPRAVPVVEAVAGISLLDAWLSWPPDEPTQNRF